MKTPRRLPRAGSKLTRLPVEQLAEIYGWITGPEGGLEVARTLCLGKLSLAVSLDTLSRFRAWYYLQAEFVQADAEAQAQEELMRRFDPADAERARKFGQFTFMQRAIRSEDAETFQAMSRDVQRDRQLAQKDADLSLADRRVALLEKKLAEAQGALDDKTLSAAEQAARIREIFQR